MASVREQSWKTLPLGVQSFSLSFLRAPDVIRAVAGLGVNRVEFYHGHISPRSSQQELATLKRSLGGVSICAYGLYTFSEEPKHNETAFAFAKAIGARTITANASPRTFPSLTKLVDKYKIGVALHNSGPGTRYERLDTLVADLKGQHELIGACLDTGHVLRSGQDPAVWAKALGSRLFAVHLTDVAQTAPQTHNVVLGQGHLNLEGLLDSLNSISFPSHGCISVGYQASACARLETPSLPFDPIIALGASLRQLGI